MSQIRYIKRAAIDDAKWNTCIETASNGLIYGYTFYLDAMCTHWDGLVFDDYRAVMPLPWRKKCGISYLYHPFAIAQLGVFGNGISAEMVYGFLKNIPAQFRYWDLPLNFGNDFYLPQYALSKHTNYVLHLTSRYEAITKKYRLQLQRNIRKAQSHGCQVQITNTPEPVLELAKSHAANWGTERDFQHFSQLYNRLAANGNAKTYIVKHDTGTILAGAVFFILRQRAYYILPGNHPDSRRTGSSHLLIDTFIRDHAGQNLTLDFEGSDVAGLQFFYSSFGAVNEPYVSVRLNRLPWYLKWLKR